MSEVYVVVEISCNSSYNDMNPPSVRLFSQKEAAVSAYMKLKSDILLAKEEYDIDCEIYKEKCGGETIIQEGGYTGAKRPVGASFLIRKIDG